VIEADMADRDEKLIYNPTVHAPAPYAKPSTYFRSCCMKNIVAVFIVLEREKV
jgi:hypothetical protein